MPETLRKLKDCQEGVYSFSPSNDSETSGVRVEIQITDLVEIAQVRSRIQRIAHNA